MTATQTKTDWMLERIGERLGVAKPTADVQLAFVPEPLSLVANLVALLADPAAAKKRVAEYADIYGKANETIKAAKQAQADLDAAKLKHDETLASDLAAHTVELQRRSREIEARESALAEREKKAEKLLEGLKADRAKLDKKLAAVRQAAVD